MEKNIKVIGIGNTLCGDDGLGVWAIRRLKDEGVEENVVLVEGETDPWYSLGEVLEADFVIIIDAVQGGGMPGTIYLCDLQETDIDNIHFSCHEANLIDLIFLLRTRGKKIKGWLVGMEPQMVDESFRLSSVVKERLGDLTREIRKILDGKYLFF